jgi:hypothetical protein
MKTSVSALVFLLVPAAGSTRIYLTNLADDMDVVKQESMVSFKIKTKDNVAPEMTPEKDTFVAACIASSYNELHNPEEYIMEAVEIETEDVTPASRYQQDDAKDNRAGLSYDWKRYPWLWSYNVVNISGICRMCPPDALASTHDYPKWEAKLCQCLNGGSFEDLKTASNCVIERPDAVKADTKLFMNFALRGSTDGKTD